MSDSLTKLWDSFNTAVPEEAPQEPQKGSLEKLWDSFTSKFQNRPPQSPPTQRSASGEGGSANSQGESLQGSKKGLAGQMAFDDVFTNLISAESGGKHLDERGKLIKSKVGAEGITQLMPSTAKKPGFGIEPVKDKSEEEYKRVGKEYLQALHKRFEGDWEKTLAAYNAGLGHVNKAIGKAERFGGEWKDYLPKKEETLPYIQKILGTKKGNDGKEK